MIKLDDLFAAVNLPDFDWPLAHNRMAPGHRRQRSIPQGVRPRQAAVLVLIYPAGGDWHIVLTRRTDQLRGHSGQISFPGGKVDKADASFTEAALRETCEELGLCEPKLTIVGMLSPVYIPPSNFEVFPTVATMAALPDFEPNPAEVAEVFTFAVSGLLDDRCKQIEEWDIQGMAVQIPFYLVNGHKVWGATAVMLSELEQRLRIVLDHKA